MDFAIGYRHADFLALERDWEDFTLTTPLSAKGARRNHISAVRNGSLRFMDIYLGYLSRAVFAPTFLKVTVVEPRQFLAR
jgi:hypothetical protein